MRQLVAMAAARNEANYLPTAYLLCWLANSFKKEDASPIGLDKFLPPKKRRRTKQDDAAVDGWIDRNAKKPRAV